MRDHDSNKAIARQGSTEDHHNGDSPTPAKVKRIPRTAPYVPSPPSSVLDLKFGA